MSNNETTPLVSNRQADGGSKKSYDAPSSILPTFLNPVSASGIGLFGSIAIAVNNLTGPGMLDLPATFQKSGVIPTGLTIVFVSILSSMTCLILSNSIGKIKPSRHSTKSNYAFSTPMEYSDAFKYYYGMNAFFITQFAFFLCIMSQCVASIISTAQVVDAFTANYHGQTYGLQFNGLFSPPMLRTWSPGFCDDGEECLPFDERSYGNVILTWGYVVTATLISPLCLRDMKDNVSTQTMSFLLMLMFLLEFCVSFVFNGIDMTNVTWWGTSWTELLGVVLFNFALTATMPAWLHEKSPETSVTTVVWTANAIVVMLYFFVGTSGAMAMSNVPPNFLAYLSSGAHGPITEVVADLFSFFIIGLGIPLFCIIMRYNAINGGVINANAGTFVTSVLPWAISWTLYKGEEIVQVFAWGGLVLNGLVGFIFPLFMALNSVDARGDGDVSPSQQDGVEGKPAPQEADDDRDRRHIVVDAFSWAPWVKTRSRERAVIKVLIVCTLAAVGAAIVGKVKGGVDGGGLVIG